jgi:hypothetical protein
MTCGYMPDGSTFNGVKNVLPDDYFARCPSATCWTTTRSIRSYGARKASHARRVAGPPVPFVIIRAA